MGYRLTEVSSMTGMGLRTIQRRVAEGELVAHRCGSVVLVFQEDLDNWLSTFERIGGDAA